MTKIERRYNMKQNDAWKFLKDSFLFQVLVPILTNEKNHVDWPSIVSKDIIHEVQQLKKNIDVVTGQVKGKTVLSFPLGIEDFDIKDVE